jgi:alpha-glucosidase
MPAASWPAPRTHDRRRWKEVHIVTRAFALFCLLAGTVSAEEWSVASPDGRRAIVLSLRDGRLTWRATSGGAAVVAPSPLGIRRADQAFTEGLRLAGAAETTAIDDRYEMPHGKRRLHHVLGRERTLAFANAAGARVEIVLRAHHDGVAFRYRFPETDATPRTVTEEQTGFQVPAGSTGWLLPHHMPSRYKPAYEDLFQEVAAGTKAPEPAGWSFPALFKTPARTWVLFTEAALDDAYCGVRLAAEAPGGAYRVRFPEQGEGMGKGDVNPTSSLPWTMPWRVVIMGDAAGRILESDLVSDLSPPSRVKDTSWIKPGRASWSWWSHDDSPKHAEALIRFVDLAAEMGWEYSLVDANWNFMQTGRIEDVIARAKEKGVGLLFWYNSGGPHNDVTEAPRDRMHLRDVRRAEFAKLKDWGVRGVKVDFWHSDKQDRIRQYRDVLTDAADFQLMVNFHGSTIPRGWEREFPHLVGMEGVFGAEQYKFSEAYGKKSAWHNTVLPFTRNVPGVMDYTPVTFTDLKYPRRTTNAHELALSVVFETAVQHFADSVEAYRALPEAPKTFLKQVPAAWDETRALSGEPGQSVVVARRGGDVWYVGGLNGQERGQAVRVDLSFLGPGPWSMAIIRDGTGDRSFASETRAVTAKDTIEVAMRGRGGFVMRLATLP